MNQLREFFPALVDTASKKFDAIKLTRILRELLDEEISIRDFRGLLEGLLDITGRTSIDLSRCIVFPCNSANLYPVASDSGAGEMNSADYANCVRTAFKRFISHKYTRGSSSLLAYLFDFDLEARIKDSENSPLTDEEHERLLRIIFKEINDSPTTSARPVILTSIEIRKKLRTLIEKEFPQLPVLSYQELSPDLNIEPLARISWN
jgi:type III secretion protein V